MKYVALGDVAEVVSGGTPKSQVREFWGGEIPWVTPADLSGNSEMLLRKSKRSLTAEGLASCSARLLPQGSVLLSSRAPIGYVAINAMEVATNQGFKSLVPNPELLEARYLYFWLRGKVSMLQGLGNGATFKELSKASVKRIKIPLPELVEQRRIAGILDQADAIRTKRRASLALLDELVASTLAALLGDSKDWGNAWGVAPVDQYVESTAYGTGQKTRAQGDVPVLRMGNISYAGRLLTEELKFLDRDEVDFAKHGVRRGDILFNRTNSPELVGKTCIFNLDDEYAYAGYLIRVRLKGDYHPVFLTALLNSPYGKATLRGMARQAVSQANINAKMFRGIPVPCVPMAVQQEFAARVEQINAQRALVERALEKDEELFASLQSRAFSGEL